MRDERAIMRYYMKKTQGSFIKNDIFETQGEVIFIKISNYKYFFCSKVIMEI